ncbi:alpha-tocopherol transfer protein-like [Stomoxys calcitrans]|uniref:alpha-tocopherol transfer protein-like n=1 Tax=Stomoxys calcitrans TaxID=35570 RepID=UPI0027E2A0A1|nr:alpha-tocopherol transfer protein-like [Stomoxys calcitrans]
MSCLVPLPAELQKIANIELGEVPSRIPADLLALKEWIKKQPHLRSRTDDQFLIQFLRGCKYSVEKAKEKIDNYYRLKTKHPDLFFIANIDDDTFRRFHNTNSHAVLPIPLRESGPRILFNRYSYSPYEFSIVDSLRNGSAVNEILHMSDPYACISGVMYVFDFADAKTPHLTALTPSIIIQMIKFFENTSPMRLKGLCIFNLSSYAHTITNMLLQYAPMKLKSRRTTAENNCVITMFMPCANENLEPWSSVPSKSCRDKSVILCQPIGSSTNYQTLIG